MSVINKKPFINTMLASLPTALLTSLKSCINGQGGETIFRTLKPWGSTILSTSDKSDTEVKPAIIELNQCVAQQTYEGYLIYNDTYCVLIAYSSNNDQKLTMISMTVNGNSITYEIKPCELTITELRQVIDDLLVTAGELVTVQADDIDSEDATEGQVLMADGDGGAAWDDNKLYVHNIKLNTSDANWGDDFPIVFQIISKSSTAITSISSLFAAIKGKVIRGVLSVDVSTLRFVGAIETLDEDDLSFQISCFASGGGGDETITSDQIQGIYDSVYEVE